MLHNLFMTRVKLEPPSSGAAVIQHRRRLAQDADDLTAERNLQALSSLVQYRCCLFDSYIGPWAEMWHAAVKSARK